MFSQSSITPTEKATTMSDFSDPEFEQTSNTKDNKANDYDLSVRSPATQQVDNTPKDEFTEQLLVYLALCKLGDKTAFAQLYQLSAAKLNGIAYRITRNIDSANEVLQEAFMQIWKNREQYQPHKSEPFTWLAAIVRYRAYDRLRYDKSHRQKNTISFDEANINKTNIEGSGIEESGIDDFYNAFGEFDPINSSKEALNNCLAQLEQKQSKAILMAYLYGYSREDIAEYFTAPINTIKSWIRRGIGRLKVCLNN